MLPKISYSCVDSEFLLRPHSDWLETVLFAQSGGRKEEMVYCFLSRCTLQTARIMITKDQLSAVPAVPTPGALIRW